MTTSIDPITSHEFDAFTREIALLDIAYASWRRLFSVEIESDMLDVAHGAATAESCEVLRDAAPHLFGIVEWVMRSYVVSALCRITDRDETAGRKNLTLRVVLEGTDWTNREGLKAVATTALDLAYEAVNRENGMREFRHKEDAHIDRPTAAGRKKRAAPYMDDIDRAVRTAVECYTCISTAREGKPFHIETGEGWRADPSMHQSYIDDVDRLVALLKAGLLAGD